VDLGFGTSVFVFALSRTAVERSKRDAAGATAGTTALASAVVAAFPASVLLFFGGRFVVCLFFFRKPSALPLAGGATFQPSGTRASQRRAEHEDPEEIRRCAAHDPRLFGRGLGAKRLRRTYTATVSTSRAHEVQTMRRDRRNHNLPKNAMTGRGQQGRIYKGDACVHCEIEANQTKQY
jgi:hypothetical protein